MHVYVMVPHAHRPGSPPRGAHARSVTGARAVCNAHATRVLCVTHISAPTTESRGPLWGVVAHSVCAASRCECPPPPAGRRPGIAPGLPVGPNGARLGHSVAGAALHPRPHGPRERASRVRGYEGVHDCVHALLWHARGGQTLCLPAGRLSLTHTHTALSPPSLQSSLPCILPPFLPSSFLSLALPRAPSAVERRYPVPPPPPPPVPLPRRRDLCVEVSNAEARPV